MSALVRLFEQSALANQLLGLLISIDEDQNSTDAVLNSIGAHPKLLMEFRTQVVDFSLLPAMREASHLLIAMDG
jgi:hypothetical protein